MEEVKQFFRNLIPASMDAILTIVLGLIVFIIGHKLVKKLLKMFRKGMEKRNMEPGVVSFLISAIKICLYVLLVVVVAQIWGIATSSIVAVIGSAGLAIGLALQGSLANFAGGVLILLMKPFVVNDYIIVDNVEGTVQKIDVVYTTLTTIDNRAVILPNGKLADSNIVNVTREDKRRIDIEVGIEYSEDIKRVREVLQKIVDHQKARIKDMPIDIVVSELGESAITMAIHMWVTPEEYWPTKWGMLEEIKEDFAKENIVIPFNQLDVNVTTVKE